MGRHAIFIANWAFDQLPELKTPQNDIRAWRDLALDQPESGEIAPTFVENEDSTGIKDALERFLGAIRDTDPDAFVMVYYTGHGCPNERGELVMAARDSRNDQPHRWLEFSEVAGALHRHEIKKALIILDCCFSGIAGQTIQDFRGISKAWTDTFQAFTRQSVESAQFTEMTAAVIAETEDASGPHLASPRFERKGDPSIVYLITATTASQIALGDQLDGKGILTRYVTDCFNGKIAGQSGSRNTRTVITVKNLFRRVYRKMLETGQTPQLFATPSGSEDLVVAELDLLGVGSLSSGASSRSAGPNWRSGSVFDHIGPTYILDSSFHLADWNAAFESLIATPLKLARRSHVAEFLTTLENWESDQDRGVKRRSTEDFRPGNIPTEHYEKLEYSSTQVGLIVFDKLASQLREPDGFWCVTLSPSFIQRPEAYWTYLKTVIKMDQLWSRYATSYDRIIGDYEGFQDLVTLVTGLIPNDAQNVLDIGAGTGASTIAAAQMASHPRVDAIEMNAVMLQMLREKLAVSRDFRRRVALHHANCLSLLTPGKDGKAPPDFPDAKFDACVMLNVLFALEDPAGVLRQVNRVLRPGGTLVLSTSRKTTDVGRLFSSIRASLERRGIFEERELDYQNARDRNFEMNDRITRHAVEEIESLLVGAGFEIDNGSRISDAYDGCVVVLRCVKE
jgi:ubiquinone/menaquinone biosynthesis C-methylase UbiE